MSAKSATCLCGTKVYTELYSVQCTVQCTLYCTVYTILYIIWPKSCIFQYFHGGSNDVGDGSGGGWGSGW